jgi:hypothetical protein
MFLVRRLTHPKRGVYECRLFWPEIDLILAGWKAVELHNLSQMRRLVDLQS